MHNSEQHNQIRVAINKIVSAKKLLRKLKVFRTEKVVSELGEWLFTAIYGGERAKSSSQKGWDVKLGEKRIQIKTHAKGDGNKARWTFIKSLDFDELVIIVFTSDYFLKEFYYVPIKGVMKRLDGEVIKWDRLREYKISLGSLPKKHIVKRYMN